MKALALLPRFKNPAAHWRPMPLWVWNNEMTESRIDAMLADFVRSGMGGVYIHPRPGLITEYLSEEWFRLWRHAADRCKELGIHCEIYDENSYPSGFAGGHVVANCPESVVWFVKCRCLSSPVYPDQTVICWSDTSGHLLGEDAWKTATPAHPVLCYTHETPRSERWTAGFPRADITRRETVQTFLNVTHRAYGNALHTHIGHTTRYVFTDEPTIYRHENGLYYSDHLKRAFRNDHGYDLAPCLPALFVDRADSPQVRHDYYFTCNRLVCTNYYQAVHDCCEELGIGFTGHIDEHLWPLPTGTPSVMAALRWMHVPGNDLLAFQFFPDNPDHPSMRMMRLNLHQLDSIAAQCGREQQLTESCGGGGYQYNPNQMKPLEDVLLAFGVNQINPHLAYASCAGSRKMDYPQTISDHSPWFMDYRDQADHVARVCSALAEGVPAPKRLLVIAPDTSGWLLYRPVGEADCCCYRGGVGDDNRKDSAIDRMRDSFLELIEALDAGQIDYDLGDETVMAEMCTIENNQCRIGEAVYEAVILPMSLRNLESCTCDLLEVYMKNGGTCYSEGSSLPSFVNGRKSDRLQSWHGSVKAFSDKQSLIEALRADYPPYITTVDGSPLPSTLFWRKVVTSAGELFFLANPWSEAIICTVKLPGMGVLELDTSTGAALPRQSVADVGGHVFDLHLHRFGHALLLCVDKKVSCEERGDHWEACRVSLQKIEADEQNILVIDQVKLFVDDELICSGHPCYCDTKLWQRQGFSASLWDASIQFKQTFLNRDFSETRPFRAEYEFYIAPACPLDGLSLCIERPGLWTVLINDQLCTIPGDVYFDENMRRIPCGNLLRKGKNRIVLARSELAPHCELAPIWLMGEFSLAPQDAGFTVTCSRALELGDIGKQGMPLYRGSVSYHATLSVLRSSTQLQLTEWLWEGVCIRIAIDGVPVGRVWRRHDTVMIDRELSAGNHDLLLTVVGDMGNCMGPHHCSYEVLSRAVYDREAYGQNPIPGRDYRTMPHGLNRLPRVLCQ